MQAKGLKLKAKVHLDSPSFKMTATIKKVITWKLVACFFALMILSVMVIKIIN